MQSRDEQKNDYTISRLPEDEKQSALELAWRVFSEYESPDYIPEGTEEFRKCLHDEEYLAGIEYYGAFDREKLIGTIGIRPDKNHICFFFVDGDYHRKGIGAGMFHHLLKSYSGKTITLNASTYGLPFYKAIGFVPTDKEKTVNGIRFTPMKYRQEALIMNDYIAYCGLDCETCEARLATINDDNELRIKVSKEWSRLNGVEITPEMINCSGCRIPGVKTPYCDMLCPIRQCAREKQIETCGGCPEMKSCEKVGAIIGNNPDARDRLEIAGSV